MSTDEEKDLINKCQDAEIKAASKDADFNSFFETYVFLRNDDEALHLVKKFMGRTGKEFLNSISKDFGFTMLTHAANRSLLKTVKYLCNEGAAVDEFDDFDRTPLMRAAKNGHIHVVEYLVTDRHAEVDKMSRSGGHTALSLSNSANNVAISNFLKEMGATKGTRDAAAGKKAQMDDFKAFRESLDAQAMDAAKSLAKSTRDLCDMLGIPEEERHSLVMQTESEMVADPQTGKNRAKVTIAIDTAAWNKVLNKYGFQIEPVPGKGSAPYRLTEYSPKKEQDLER